MMKLTCVTRRGGQPLVWCTAASASQAEAYRLRFVSAISDGYQLTPTSKQTLSTSPVGSCKKRSGRQACESCARKGRGQSPMSPLAFLARSRRLSGGTAAMIACSTALWRLTTAGTVIEHSALWRWKVRSAPAPQGQLRSCGRSLPRHERRAWWKKLPSRKEYVMVTIRSCSHSLA